MQCVRGVIKHMYCVSVCRLGCFLRMHLKVLTYDTLHNRVQFFIHALWGQFFVIYDKYSFKCNRYLLSASKCYEQQTYSQVYYHWNNRNHPLKRNSEQK